MQYVLIWTAVAFGIGIALGQPIGHGLPVWGWLVCAGGCLAASALLHRWSISRRTALCLAVLCLGVLRIACEQPCPDWLSLRIPSLQAVRGTVVSYPSIGRSHTVFTLRPDTFSRAIRVTWFRDGVEPNTVHYGDRICVVGSAKLPEPFEGFDYPGYLARQGIFATMTVDERGLDVTESRDTSFLHRGDRIRQTLFERLHHRLQPDESAMARSLLFGDRTALPEPIEEAFSRSGLMHLLAVSGLHLGIFLGGAWWILRKLGLRPRIAYPVVGVLVLLALWIVGPRISLVRAALLFAFLGAGSVLADVGLILRRSIRPLNGLAAAAICILALRPGALCDAGFQLTFAATASILMVFSMPFEWRRRIDQYTARLGRWRIPVRYALTLVTAACAAQAGAAPVIAWHFETIHPVALVANLLVVPLAGLALWCGFGALLFSGTALFPYAITPFSAVLRGVKTIVTGLSRIPLVELEVSRWVGLWLGAMVVFVFAVAAYDRVSSSWTSNSTSIAVGSSGPRSGARRPP